MANSIDEVRRTRMLQDEGRVVTCDHHIIGFTGINKVYDIRRKIKCGYKNCPKDGQYEIELQF